MLNKQGDSIHPWHTPFPIWNQSVVPCPVLTVASWPAHRFLKRQVRWSVFPSPSEFSKVYCDPHSQRLCKVNKEEIDIFLELSCFFDDPVDVGNLIYGSSVFSKTSLNIWKFMVHILLKRGLKNFKHTYYWTTNYETTLVFSQASTTSNDVDSLHIALHHNSHPCLHAQKPDSKVIDLQQAHLSSPLFII